MGLKKQNVINYYLYDTQVEDLFLSEYLPGAPGDYVKVYLLALMHAQLGQDADDEALAGQLALPLETVRQAWNYWESQGIIEKFFEDPSDRHSYTVEFVNLREKVFGRVQTEETPVPPALDDKAISQLYHDVETVCGRLLDARELEEIAAWVADYRIDPSVILYCYRYCSAKRRSDNYRYVGKILKDWKSRKLESVDDVMQYLSEADGNFVAYRTVFRELGFTRNPTAQEKRIMDAWFDELGASLDEALAACRKTSGISNPNINYVDSVLRAQKGAAAAKKKDDLISQVYAQYERDREANEAKAAAIRSRVFEQIPEMEGVLEQTREKTFELSSAMLSGGAKAAEVRKAIEGLNQQKASLLQKAGFPPDALDVRYSCSRCRDTGLLEDGSRCSCFDEKLARLMAAASNGQA